MAYLATLGCILTTDNPTAQAQIQTPPSSKVLIDGSGVYKGILTILINGASSGSMVQTAPITTTLTGTSKKVFVENEPCVLVGDKSVVATIPVTDPASGSSGTVPVTVTIQSSQIKVEEM